MGIYKNVKRFVADKSTQLGVVATVGAMSVGAHAEGSPSVSLPTVDIQNLIGFIGLLVTAIATVATANLLIPMTAKGIKAIKTAF